MRTTVDIPDREVEEAVRLSGAKTEGDAIAIAVAEFNRRRRLDRLASELGSFENVPASADVVRAREHD